MASTGPLSAPNAGVPPRPKRQPRKLDYLKCSSCRKAKVKCTPRHPTTGKCTRCWHRNLVCSGLHRKSATIVQTQPPEQLPVTRPTHSDATFDYDVHDAHMLISLYHILDMTIQELIVIGKEQLLFMSHNDTSAWKIHLKQLDVVVKHYSDMMESLEEALRRVPFVSGYIITAFMNLKYPAHSTDRATSIEDAAQLAHVYLSRSHYGMAHIFQMRTLEYKEPPEEGDIKTLLRTRDDFCSAIESVLKRHDITLDTYNRDAPHQRLNFSETQLFFPRKLLQIPGLAAAVENDGRRDILGRLPSHIVYDAKVNLDSAFAVRTDDIDVLGRSTLHIACSMTTQERRIRELNLTSVAWSSKWMLGLNALHVAAARGDVDIFYTAATFEHDFFADHHSFSYSGRSFLHWAARYGHLELMQFLVGMLGDRYDVLHDEDHMNESALHYAARYGHTDIAKTILSYTDSEERVTMNPYDSATVFFSAVIGGHLDIMQLLESHMDVQVNEEDSNELGMVLSPLAEVARQGFLDCVRYFLNHEQVSINAPYEQKTPLDHAVDNMHDKCIELMRHHGAMTHAELMDSIQSVFSNEGDEQQEM